MVLVFSLINMMLLTNSEFDLAFTTDRFARALNGWIIVTATLCIWILPMVMYRSL